MDNLIQIFKEVIRLNRAGDYQVDYLIGGKCDMLIVVSRRGSHTRTYSWNEQTGSNEEILNYLKAL